MGEVVVEIVEGNVAASCLLDSWDNDDLLIGGSHCEGRG
jgi:hypothetical protein